MFQLNRIISKCLATALVLLPLLGIVGVVQAQESEDPLVAVPDELATELQIQVAYDGDQIVWRFAWPAEIPHFYHDMLRYEDGTWVRHGASPVGGQEFGIYEDRLTFLVDPGTIRGFANQGCYASCHAGLRFMSDELGAETIEAHPYLGEELGRSDLRKYVPDSRVGETWWEAPWDQVKSQEELEHLAEVGVFLDFWHWRAHRSNPIGYADDQYVLEYRNSDDGRGPYATNWDAENSQPALMFDEEQVGFVALDWETMLDWGYSQDDVYYITRETAVPFDATRDWQNGDVIPRRILQTPDGSHGTIEADGRWADGVWRLEMWRDMDTGFPTDDHPLIEGRTYNIGFAIHKNATGSRWHYISHPQTVGIGTPADVTAVRFDGDRPNWNAVPAVMVPMWYPAQINWEWLTSDAHPGAPEVRADTRSCEDCHGGSADAVLKLAQASVNQEVGGNQIRMNWWLTLAAGLSLLIGGTATVLTLSRREEQ